MFCMDEPEPIDCSFECFSLHKLYLVVNLRDLYCLVGRYKCATFHVEFEYGAIRKIFHTAKHISMVNDRMELPGRPEDEEWSDDADEKCGNVVATGPWLLFLRLSIFLNLGRLRFDLTIDFSLTHPKI